ncbi:elongation factor P--(R)-beta-lysine ligase [Thorsellia kenyensis]|uniref:Elongation factor P--(R)-beta-lysine ligase n=1 Tax=Thorsellia kenyensis TaxID=1549888 RepID=A0ABV6CCM2_9GAMM
MHNKKETLIPPYDEWQPTASNTTLVKRANFMRRIRQFFEPRGVLEVETPILSQFAVTDTNLSSFKTELYLNSSYNHSPLYLITSPEYHMKRMVASGSGAIFQIGKCFRNEESGRIHNPEFTMLEWYRPFFTMMNLIKEVDELLQYLLNCPACDYLSYQHAMQKHLNIDPLTDPLCELQTTAVSLGWDGAKEENHRDTLLQFLFAIGVEPHIGLEKPMAIFHFPASQAALAKINETDHRVAERFEFYYKGVELANGFHELTCPIEQRKRFELDNLERIEKGLMPMPIDEYLLAALSQGMPPTSGVAIGLDRVFMLSQNKSSLAEIMSFPITKA